MTSLIIERLTREDKDIEDMFYLLKSKADLAELLEIPLNRLLWHLHKADKSLQYQTFLLPKKSGNGHRAIDVPVTAIKIIQKKLNYILQLVYGKHKKSGVHGFVKGESIVTNAHRHINANLVFNIDLLDFFPTITFGRVRGIFQQPPYNLNTEIGTALAQICCFQSKLPQGAPTSPIISNIVCARLDVELKRLAARGGCTYSRYADDITFSSRKKTFPRTIVNVSTRSILPGSELLDIIRNNGFKINNRKVWFLSKEQTKHVTGIVVHKAKTEIKSSTEQPGRLNVSRKFYREIRTLLFCWEKFGYEEATRKMQKKYNKYRAQATRPPKLEHVVRGKVAFFGQVRGKKDAIYLKYVTLFNELYSRDCK